MDSVHISPAAAGTATGTLGYQDDGKHAKPSSIDGRSKTDGLTDFQRDMRAFHAQAQRGGGMMAAEVIRREHAFALITGRTYVVDAMWQWAKMVRAGGRPSCLCCDHIFLAAEDVPPACVVTRTMWRSGRVVFNAVCEVCAEQSTDEKLLEVAYEHFREMGLAQEKIT